MSPFLILYPQYGCVQKVVAVFGGDVVGSDGRIDRAKLRECIFRDAKQRARLNAITHPVIIRRIILQVRWWHAVSLCVSWCAAALLGLRAPSPCCA